MILMPSVWEPYCRLWLEGKLKSWANKNRFRTLNYREPEFYRIGLKLVFGKLIPNNCISNHKRNNNKTKKKKKNQLKRKWPNLRERAETSKQTNNSNNNKQNLERSLESSKKHKKLIPGQRIVIDQGKRQFNSVKNFGEYIRSSQIKQWLTWTLKKTLLMGKHGCSVFWYFQSDENYP